MARSSKVSVDVRHTRTPGVVRDTVQRVITTDEEGSEFVNFNGQVFRLFRKLSQGRGRNLKTPFFYINRPMTGPREQAEVAVA